MSITIKFWGVRGSTPCPSPSHQRYGGNTACVEVRVGGETLIFDSGTGIRDLGRDLLKRGMTRAHLFLTHTHWDHIIGFPFFAPAFVDGFKLTIYAGHLTGKGGIHDLLSQQMAEPTFPVPLSAMKGQLNCYDFKPGQEITPADDIRLKTRTLNHPGGGIGYRLEAEGKTISYITDTEHVPGETDENVVALMNSADLVIYDCTYTEQEFKNKIGWGHSTWEEGVRLAQKANAAQLAIFHHNPDHDDEAMDKIADQSKNAWANSFVTRDGIQVEV